MTELAHGTLRSLNHLCGYAITAIDGEFGKVHDFLFDDVSWTVRYVVADTARWLPGRQVLLAPAAVGHPDWLGHRVPVNLTKEQISGSPPVEKDEPMSRQLEGKLARYYGWPLYWMEDLGGMAIPEAVADTGVNPDKPTIERRKRIEAAEHAHIRSIREVKGYHVEARDGAVGHVDDFIVEEETWAIRYVVVDTHNWVPGKRVLLPPSAFEKVSWSESNVHVPLTREQVKNSPPFDPSAPINHEYETRLYDYYGRPAYWP